MKPFQVTFHWSHTHTGTNPPKECCQHKRTSPTDFSKGWSRGQNQRAAKHTARGTGRAACQGEASRSSASPWLKTLLLYKKNIMKNKLVVPSSSERGYFLNLHQCNNATMSIILNQLSFLSCVPEEELIFSRSQHGQSYIRIHGRTEMTSLRSPDRQVPKTAAACIGRCLSCSNNYMIRLCNEKNLKQT